MKVAAAAASVPADAAADLHCIDVDPAMEDVDRAICNRYWLGVAARRHGRPRLSPAKSRCQGQPRLRSSSSPGQRGVAATVLSGVREITAVVPA